MISKDPDHTVILGNTWGSKEEKEFREHLRRNRHKRVTLILTLPRYDR